MFTAAQSSEKSRLVLFATWVRRNRKLAFAVSATVQACPHVSPLPPSVFDDWEFERFPVCWADVHVTPPSHESSPQILRVLDEVESTQASSRTAMPVIVAFAGKPKL
jgi:hypothetical protein